MFRSIVAGTDGSPSSRAAVAKAAELAQLTSAHLHLVIAFRSDRHAATTRTAERPLSPREDDDEVRREVIARLAGVADGIKASGVAVSTHWRDSGPADALIDVAVQQRADVIVVGNRGMQGAKRLRGSVPNDVSHRAPCAVLIFHTT